MDRQDPAGLDLVGTVVDGRFEVLGKLGEGGMGAIYRARQLSMERMVALKILLRNRRGDPISVERFRHEAYLASRLRHPHAVVIHDFGQSDDGLLYIAMELLAGENLKQRIKRTGPMPLGTAIQVLRQTLRPISQAHRMGLIHRDLKPANIFLTEVEGDPDFVKVLDFGVAKLTAVHDGIGDGYQGGLTVQGKIYGTPNYMSPEQIRGKELNLQSDLYSLAVIFYEMLCGCRPFEAETPVDVMMMHLRDAPKSMTVHRPDVPEGLQLIMKKALAKERSQRFRNGEEFLEALEPYRSAQSAEHFAWGGDEANIPQPDTYSSFSDVGESHAPILSGLDLSADGFGFPDDSDLLSGDLGDLADEKTVLEVAGFEDDGPAGIELDNAAEAVGEEMDERTVFEHAEGNQLQDFGRPTGSEFGGEDSIDVSGASAPRHRVEEEDVIESEAFESVIIDEIRDDAGSVMELSDGDLEMDDPSRLVDIPQVDGFSDGSKRAKGGPAIRRTVAGHPGVSSLLKQKLEEQEVQREPRQWEVEPGPIRDDSYARAPGGADLDDKPTNPVRLDEVRVPRSMASPPASAAEEAPPRRGATAFSIPMDARVQKQKRRRPSRKVVLGSVSLIVLGVSAFIVTKLLSGQPQPPAAEPPALVVACSAPKAELYVNGRYIGALPTTVPLKANAESQKLQIKADGRTFTAQIANVQQKTWLYVRTPKMDIGNSLSAASIQSLPPGAEVRQGGQLLGKTPLVFLGTTGMTWQIEVSSATKTVKRAINTGGEGSAVVIPLGDSSP
ncbi:MAG: serine/threonine-protein kinase [Myxococcota bacterium]|nr:serine/threonine-protein kinase [Myxococcota bacterium]